MLQQKKMRIIKKRKDGIVQVYHKVEKKGRTITTRKGSVVINTAERIKKVLAPLSERIEIVGSQRRGNKNPTDIDIIIIPKHFAEGNGPYYCEYCNNKIIETIKKIGGKILRQGKSIISFNINGIQADIYFATKEDWGAMLLTYTGSFGHNIGLRKIAQSKGLLLNQYGLWKGKQRIAGATEEEIYKALDRPRFKKPEERQ